jgi:hypothetical protein
MNGSALEAAANNSDKLLLWPVMPSGTVPTMSPMPPYPGDQVRAKSRSLHGFGLGWQPTHCRCASVGSEIVKLYSMTPRAE